MPYSGTGIKSEVRGLFADAITLINASGVPVVAVDIPSGLHTDNGMPLGVAMQAEMTVALGFAKLGEVIYPGSTTSVSWSSPTSALRKRAVAEVAPKTELLDRETIRWLVPRRAPDTHKGTYGHLVSRRRLARQNRRGDSRLPRRDAHAAPDW